MWNRQKSEIQTVLSETRHTAGLRVARFSLAVSFSPFSRLSPRRIKLFQNAPFTLMSVWWGAMRETGTGEPQICERAEKWHCKSTPTLAR
jgi:hypothetical protein